MSEPTTPELGHPDVDDHGTTATIRVQPPPVPRGIRAFTRLAAVVDRALSAEVPPEPEGDDPAFPVFVQPPDGERAGRRRADALDALARAVAEHEAAVRESHRCWEDVHALEAEVARLSEEEQAALRTFELARESRRRAERKLREARIEGDAASRGCLAASRVREAARIRAERL